MAQLVRVARKVNRPGVPSPEDRRFVHFVPVGSGAVLGCRRCRSLIAIALMSLAIAASSCGGGGGSASAADNQFLLSVHAAAPDIGSYRTDTALVRIGHAACDGFSSHASYEQLADQLALREGSDPLPSEDLGAVITSAVQTFCPQFEDQVS